MRFPPSLVSTEQKRAYALGMVHTLWEQSYWVNNVQYVGPNEKATLYSEAFFKIVTGFKQATGEDLGSTAK